MIKPNCQNISSHLSISKYLNAIPHKMPGKTKFWFAAILVAIILAAALYFWLKPDTPPAPLPKVETETVTTSDVNLYGEYVGRIRAQQFVEVHARVEGYLERMCFKEG